jgi:hypothetical protein
MHLVSGLEPYGTGGGSEGSRQVPAEGLEIPSCGLALVVKQGSSLLPLLELELLSYFLIRKSMHYRLKYDEHII